MQSLNGGVGSNDTPDKVAENRARMALALGVAPERLLTALSDSFARRRRRSKRPGAETIGRAPMPSSRARRIWRSASRPPTAGRCCLPTSRRGVIGAAHAGWRGAFTGVIEATFAGDGKARRRPRQHQRSRSGRPSGRRITKSGRNSSSRFLAADADNARFFADSAAGRPRHVRSHRLYRCARSTRRHCEIRRSRPLHLCRARALLQLPPLDPSERAGLRTPHQCHRARPIRTRIRWWWLLRSPSWTSVRSSATLGSAAGVVRPINHGRRGVTCVLMCRSPPRVARRCLPFCVCSCCRRPSFAPSRSPAADSCGPPSAAAGSHAAPPSPSNSIDGPPPAQFNTLVRSLNDEAQARRLAVISRETPVRLSRARLSGRQGCKGRTTIAWVWDVFDRDQRRACASTARKPVKGAIKPGSDAWSVADDAMLRRIARTSMDQLAVFLTSPSVRTGAPPTSPWPARSGRPTRRPRPPAFSAFSRPMPIQP